eukprot:COSAG06_NODE_648_length_13415_cov_83.005783_5_plen_1504_part_00
MQVAHAEQQAPYDVARLLRAEPSFRRATGHRLRGAAMPGGRNGSRKWGGHQPHRLSRREDHWGDGGAYGFRGGLGTPQELRERRRATIDRADEESSATADPVTLFVQTGASRTRTVHIELRASVAELEEAVRRKVPEAEEWRLCAVGGATLAAGRPGLTLAECGLRAGSSLQLLGQLPGGGGELILGGRRYAHDAGRLNLAWRLEPAELAELARWLATDAGAAVASLKIGGADLGSIYVTGALNIFQIPVDDGAGVAYRNSPDMGDTSYEISSQEVAAELSQHTAIDQTDDWIQVAESRWLPKKFLVEVDTTEPCAFQVLCDALKASQVTEVDFSACGLTSPAMEILSGYVRDATAAISSLVISKNAIFGSKVENKGEWNEKAVHDTDKDQSGWNALCEQLKNSSITSFTARDIGMGPVALRTLATSLPAALTNTCLLHNPLGEGVNEIIKVFEETPRLRTLCGFEEGVEHIDWKDSGKGPTDVALLSAELKVGRAVAAVEAVVLKGNKITGSSNVGYTDAKYDNDLSGIIALCEALPGLQKPISLDLSDCGLSVKGVTEIAKATSAAAAAVNRLMLDANFLTGRRDVDKDIAGVTALFDTLKTSSVTELGLANCRLGPGSLAKLAKYVREATAAISSVVISNNFIFGSKDRDKNRFDFRQVHDVDGDQSGWNNLCEQLKVSKIASFTAADVGMGPVALRTLATSLPAEIVSVNCLANHFGEEGLATLLTAIEGTSVRSLCGLTEGHTTADFSGQNLSPIDCKILAAEYDFRGFIAVVADLNISEAIIGDAGPTLVEAVSASSSLEFVTIGKGLRLPLKDNYDSDILDAAGKGIEAGGATVIAWWLTTSAAAAVESIDLSGCGLTGATPRYGDSKKYGRENIDSNMDGFVALCAVLGRVRTVCLAGCGLGPSSAAELSKIFSDATTALNSISCLMNPIGEEGLATLVASVKDSSVRSICGLTDGQDIADFSGMGLRSFDLKILKAEFDFRGAIAAVDTVILKHNMITGSERVYEGGMRVWKYDVDLSGLIALCEALPGLQKPISLDLSSCGLSVKGVTEIAKATSAGAEIVSVNCLANHFGEEGLATLLTAIEGTSVRSLCGLTEGQTTADFSGQNLSPIDCKILAAEYDFRGFIAALNLLTIDSTGDTKDWRGYWNNGGPKTYTLTAGEDQIELSQKNLGSADVALLTAWVRRPEVSAAISSVVISSNFIFGTKDKGRYDSTQVHDVDGDQSGWNNLCEQLKVSKITSFTAADVGMGPVALRTLATSLPTAVVADLNISEAIIGDAGPTLVEAVSASSSLEFVTIGKGLRLPLKDNYDSDILDAAGKGIEAGGATVIAWWLSTDAAAAVADLNVSHAIIGDAGFALVETVRTSTSLKFITIGNGLKLPLKEKYDSRVLDAANRGIESGGAIVIAWWLTTKSAASVSSLRCVDNPGMFGRLDHHGDLMTPDAHAEVFNHVCDNLQSINRERGITADFSGCGIKKIGTSFPLHLRAPPSDGIGT